MTGKQHVTLVALIIAVAACGSDSKSSTPTEVSVAATVVADTTVIPDTNQAPETAPTVETTAVPGSTAGPAGVDAEGRIEFRQTVVGFVQNTVIAYGEQGLDSEVLADAILTTYPSLTVAGYAVDADETTISLWSNSASPKDSTSAENPWVVAVAVMDTSGGCLGGVAYGYPLATETLEIDEPAPCNAETVVAAAIAQL